MSTVSIRRTSRHRDVLTAASAGVRSQSDFRKPIDAIGRATAGNWQELAWDYVELVGELDYYVRWRSSSVSRCRLVASELDDHGVPTGGVEETSEGTPTAEGKAVQTIVTGMASGLRKILRRIAYILSVPGECWVAMLVRDPSREKNPATGIPDRTGGDAAGEQWFVFDRSEINVGRDLVLTLPDGVKHTFNPAVDLMFRIWDENPRSANLATSPVWSTRPALNEIVRATATIDNASKSRLIGNGILCVPQEVSLPQQQGPVPVPPGANPTTTATPQVVGMHASAQDFQDLLYDVAVAAMKDPDSIAGVLPIIASMPGDQIRNMQWIRPASEVPATALTTRDKAITRLALGLDVSPERLLGIGTNSNHWSAWNIDQTDVKIHIAPLAEMICAALTTEVLRPKLTAEGIDPDKYVVWFDATDLTQDPDKKEAAKDAYDRGALSASALREHLGLEMDDGYDLSTTDGWLEMILDRVSQDPKDNFALFKPVLKELLKGKLADMFPDAPVPPALAQGDGTQDPNSDPNQPPDAAQTPQSEPQAGAPTQKPNAPQQAPQRAQTAAAGVLVRMCVSRALELANKRRRTRSNAHLFRDVPIELAHTAMEPVPRTEITDLIKGWDTGLTDTDIYEIGADAGRFRHLVRAVSSTALEASAPPALPTTSIDSIMKG